MDKLKPFLEHYFGYTTFKDGQRQIIEAVIRGEDVFAMLATGSGKSLCYQFPALWKNGTAIIVSPLLSLMENQVQELKQAGIRRAAAYNSFLSPPEKEYILRHLNDYKIVYISPESLQQPEFASRLQKLDVSLLAVDEAHCISQWGHEFRTDYLRIKEIRRMAGNPPCIALTATAAAEARKDIMEKLELTRPFIHCDSVDRPNIYIDVRKKKNEEEKRTTLQDECSRLPLPGMIYVSSRHKAEELAAFIREENGLKTSAYHGGMSNEDRRLVQQQFLNDEIDVICCTNAFGMGINKPNIRFVIHYHYSKDMESFMQEIGRAGRDGRQSLSLVLFDTADGMLPRRMIEHEFPSEEEVRMVSHDPERPDVVSSRFLLERYGLEEVHARFLQYYIQTWQKTKGAEPLDEFVSAVIERRMEWKLEKLKQKEHWLHQTVQCRRTTLLEVFDEHKTSTVSPCCDVCGEHTMHGQEQHRNTGQQALSWEERLKWILHQ
ncbi:RecQ family ATP-dependent DNA helicase [Salibacterium halotolerans]|uniref:ATP-dependent DNA helicase RecQ n=1 Tax=Salibacterium halotolerans TaxID=1884432 RepID=A0A1I5Q266_9BACI|nr:ATP-dependent DNA helicase RecQ [Salibacterium halotolerans]SFP40333.1 ATP-dependent DNA helicase RecQ [Salibacterium halotolerans]